MEGTMAGSAKFEREHDGLHPNMGCVMKKYELSDRQLKIAVVLAMAIIGWLCLKGAGAAHGQTTPANLSPGAQEAVKFES
jgi:hypothetical protein